ncbi:unnamed protein product [Agarophyton chilense]
MTANAPTRNPQALPTQTPPFLTKLYQLVSDPSTHALVSWTDDKGLSFTVHKPSEFGRDILPKYFKHNNFSSFVRQLNQYGFHKQNPDKWMFGHDSFRRDRPDLLKNITRRRPKQSQSSNAVLPAALTQNAVVELGHYGLEGELKSLKRDKDLLIKELVVTRQKEEQLKTRCENLETRVASLENSSKQMQAFIMHYFSQVLQPYSEAMASRKRKRLPATSVEDPDAMIVEQPPNQVASISHPTGRSSVDALRVMMQQMGVDISRSPSQPQAQSQTPSQSPTRISFEPATVQELPQEENSASISTSRRIMPPTAENTVALLHPPVYTPPVSAPKPITATEPSTSPPAVTPTPWNPSTPSTSPQLVPLAPAAFTAPLTLSNPVIPQKGSANTAIPATAARISPQPVSLTPNGSSPLVSAPNTTAAPRASSILPASMPTSASMGIVSLPAVSVLPTPTSPVSFSPNTQTNCIASKTVRRAKARKPDGTGTNLKVSHAGAPQSTPTQFPTQQPIPFASPRVLAAAYEAAHVQPLHAQPPLQNGTIQSPVSPTAFLHTPELPRTPPLPRHGNSDTHTINGVIGANADVENTAPNGDVFMSNPDDVNMATADHEKHGMHPDVDRALDFLEDMPCTPNTSMTMEAIESALEKPRSQSKGTHLDTPDFDKAFDDKEFNLSFGVDPGSVKINGQCSTSAENERVIEDFLELSADDPGLPPPLMHLPEGTDIHALAKKIESFADG